MPIYRTQADEKMRELISEVGLDSSACFNFLEKLDDDNDWAFLIKVQALVETRLTSAIVAEIGEPRLNEFFGRLPLVDEQLGKLSVAKSLGLLEAPQRRFLRFLASLRNNLAHRADHVDFTFQHHIANLPKSKISDWKNNVVWFSCKDSQTKEIWLKTSISQPRIPIWLSVFLIVVLLDAGATRAKALRELRLTALRNAGDLFLQKG